MSVILRLPPRIKVLEALSAVYGGRVLKINDKMCRVKSSDGSREYIVYVDVEKRLAYSNDNGTMYRNYVGYPIIAFLMDLNLLPKHDGIGPLLVDIPWRRLNEQYKNYSKVMEIVMSKLQEAGFKVGEVESYIDTVLKKLSMYGFRKLEKLPEGLPS